MSIVSEELINKFRIFIEKYYYVALLDSVKKNSGCLEISFSALAKFDFELTELLINNPKDVLDSAEEAVKRFDIPEAEYPIRIRLTDLPKSASIAIRNIRSKNLGTLISTEGLIRQASSVRPRVTFATFECHSCGAQVDLEQPGPKFREPVICVCGRKAKFKLVGKRLVDIQRLVVEEAPESLEGGEQPKRIAIYLEGDLLNPQMEKRRYPGNKIRVIGLIKEVSTVLPTGGQSTTYELIIEANNVQIVEEEFEMVKIDPEEIKEIEELAAKPNVYEKLVSSIAPSIYGYERIKEAIVLQLFGGVRKVREDGTKTRGDIHVFLVGDPGSGKSQLLQYVSKLAPKARYIAGKGTSAAGITATVVKDEFIRGWALEAGALVLSNKGITCLDELDKMNPEDTGAMHEALEQQTVTIAKANIHATLKAETSVLAAANPKFGRFDPYSPIPSQIDLPPTLINRFDLIFTIRDVPDTKKDEKIATHILELAKDPSTKQPDVPTSLFRKYVAYAKQKCFPKITQAAVDEIRDFYISLRGMAASEESEIKSIPISARQLEALVRLSEASAKIRLADKVTKKDAQKAISLLRSSMEEVVLDIETGRFDIDRIATGITATQRSQISAIRRLVDILTEKLGKDIPVQDLINEAESEGIDRAKIEEIIDKLKKGGEIFEPRTGLISKVR